MNFISFIIVAKNEERTLGLSLEGILNSVGRIGFEILLIDNGSTDKTIEVAEKYNVKIFKVASGTIGSLRNYGAANSRGDILCFLDADVVINSLWLNSLLPYLSRDGVACVCATEKWHGDSPTWVERAWLSLAHCDELKENKVLWSSTQAMIVKKKYFDEVGGFSNKLITCEDYDLGCRLSKKYDIIKISGIYHSHLRPSKRVKEFFVRELWRGQDSLNGVLSHGLVWRELPSILLPMLWGFALVTVVLGLGLGLLGEVKFSFILFSIGSFLLFLFPLLMVLKKNRGGGLGIWNFFLAYVLTNVYLSARFFALFLSSRRSWS